jgi:hypothetical protein
VQRRSLFRSVSALAVLLISAVFVTWGIGSAAGSQPGSFQSPVATPDAPTPTPVPPMTEETQRALQYVAEREGIPVEQLVVANQNRQEYEQLGRVFWALKLLDTESGRWHNLFVDLSDGSFVEDVEAIEQAERAAHRAKYGKLDPSLFDRLATARANEKVPVAIWVAGRARRSEEELYAALASRYPEVQAALERSGNPFDVGDPDLINEVEAEYVRMLEADTQEYVWPLVRRLEEQGYAVTTVGGLPVIAAVLPKAVILEIAERSDVGVVYLDEDEAHPELDSAVPSDWVPIVWHRGFEGNGIDIGILEPGKVDFDIPGGGHNYLDQGAVRTCGEGVDEHKTWVASVAASYHPTYMGVAPEATIVDACTSTNPFTTHTVSPLTCTVFPAML